MEFGPVNYVREMFGWAVLDYAGAKRVADRSGAGFWALVSGGGAVAKWSKVPGLSARTQISARNKRSRSPVEGRRPVSRWSLRHFGGRRKVRGWFSARAISAATHSRAQAVAERGDDNKPQGQIGSGLAPEDRAEGFDAELVMATGGEGTDGLPGNGVVGAKGFGGGGVEEVEGNHTGLSGWRAVHAAQGPGGGELEVALGLDEVGLESGAERVALPAAAVDFFAGLAHDGVIEGDHEGFVGSEVFKQWLAGLVEEVGFLDAVLGVEAVIGGPVAVLATMGADEIGDGAFIGSEKGAEHVPGEYFGTAFGGGGEVAGGVDEFLKALAQERIGVFF